ncbi:MAG: histidinol dehydrogenase [Geminicoccaceae bacterium]
MPLRLDDSHPDFDERFDALVATKREETVDVGADVHAILARVEREGDLAVVDLTERFDRHRIETGELRLPKARIDAAFDACDPGLLEALEQAARRISAFHERQRPDDIAYADDLGVRLGQRWRPIDAVGLYVPGGKAAYPSSVLMNALPARVAGVERLAITVPAPGGEVAPLVLVAARLAGIDEIYPIGGAQAVAALAYGTESIRPVDKIVGPGNAYVAEAKRQVFGRVGIDMIAGPSEVVVVADADNDPAWIAADLLSQAEHDEMAQAILITDCQALAAAVEEEVRAQLERLPKREIASKSWERLGAVVVISSMKSASDTKSASDMRSASDLVNRLAPEHLELMVADPEALAEKIRHAGSIFLGAHTPEVIGDYVGGPNHVLPTNRTARFASGLSVYDFMKRTTLLGCSPKSFSALAPAAATLAHAEDLVGHARAVELRMTSRKTMP